MSEERAAEAQDVVLDTSVFSNPRCAGAFGRDVPEVLRAFVARAARPGRGLRFFMPPSIFAELKTFVDSAAQVPPEFELVVRLQSPRRFDVQVSGALLYELIDDIRERINKGLRVAEQAVRDAHPSNVEQTIARLREKYRQALRSGLLDSREDVDVILLARELDAAVCSCDQGLVSWADKLGIRILHPERLPELLAE